jgi:hypothetical protein
MEAITVKVCEAGGVFVNVPTIPGATVEQVLRAAGVEANGKTVKLNDVSAQLSEVCHDGDTLYIMPNIKGNC